MGIQNVLRPLRATEGQIPGNRTLEFFKAHVVPAVLCPRFISRQAASRRAGLGAPLPVRIYALLLLMLFHLIRGHTAVVVANGWGFDGAASAADICPVQLL